MFVYRLTKYDRALRDERGAFQGDDWMSISDIGSTFNGTRLSAHEYLRVEAAHLSVVASFIEEANIDNLVVLAPPPEDIGHDRFLRSGLKDQERLGVIEVTDVLRLMLREELSCRLQSADRFYLQVGFDYYVFFGVDRPTPTQRGLCRRRWPLPRRRVPFATLA